MASIRISYPDKHNFEKFSNNPYNPTPKHNNATKDYVAKFPQEKAEKE